MDEDPTANRAAEAMVPDTLDGVWHDAWLRLEAGVRDRSHPCRCAVLATMGEDGVDARTVVLRGADRNSATLRVHSDRRSGKFAQLSHDRRVALVFYGDGVQLRLRGHAAVHTNDALVDAAWASTSTMARRCYLGETAPGSPSASATSGLPTQWSTTRPPETETRPGRAAFALIVITLDSLDWLHLAADGQRRAGFSREGLRWMATWLVP